MNKLSCLFALTLSALSVNALGEKVSNYAVDKELGKGTFTDQIGYIALDSAERLLVPQGSTIMVIDPTSGSTVTSFDSGIKPITSIAADAEAIYVLSVKTEQTTREISGKKYKMNTPVGVICKKFDMQGKNEKEISLPEAKSARSARIHKGQLYLADTQARKVLVYNLSTGKKEAEIGNNLRLCCGIFDFCVDQSTGDVLIANLGAFAVQRYTASGQLKNAFGKRGEAEAEFGGCCNPVSVEVLSDGALVTVEKDPSKVKLYDSQGKLLASLPGVTKLVEGCGRVPVIRDSKNNIFIAANRDGNVAVIKCSPKSK
jgi:hypothetical protein